jgi:hypothetical protein
VANDIVRSKVTIASLRATAAAIVNCQYSSIVSISALPWHNHSHGRWRSGLQFDIRALLACWLIQSFNSRLESINIHFLSTCTAPLATSSYPYNKNKASSGEWAMLK